MSAWIRLVLFCSTALGSACSSPASKACHRLAEVCNADFTKEDYRDCTDAIDAASRQTKADVGANVLACIPARSTCPEALGCAAGVGLSTLFDAKTAFERGLKRGQSLGRKEAPRTDVDPPTPPADKPGGGSTSALQNTDDRPAVRYVKVPARRGADDFGDHLIVTIDLEVLSDMNMAMPHVKVAAICGAQSETGDAFFSMLVNARRLDRKIDTIKRFHHHELGATASHCDLTLTLTEGSTPPDHYCFRDGATVHGECR